MRWLVFVLAASTAASGDDQELIRRFLSRDDSPLTRYVAWRRLEARNERFNAEGWLEACVAVSPRSGFTFQIEREGGSSYIRNKVLRKALEGERDLIARGDPARASLSADNYAIDHDGTTPATSGEMALRLRARRTDSLLLDGRVVVSDPEGDLLRVEGRLTKSPSFWTRSVDVVRRYAWRGGVRVPVETVSTADVRLAGRSTFRMVAEYLSVNGADTFVAESGRFACLVTQN